MDIVNKQEQIIGDGAESNIPEERPKSSPLFDNLAVPAPYHIGYGYGGIIVPEKRSGK